MVAQIGVNTKFHVINVKEIRSNGLFFGRMVFGRMDLFSVEWSSVEWASVEWSSVEWAVTHLKPDQRLAMAGRNFVRIWPILPVFGRG